MIELAQAIASVLVRLEPLTVPLLVINAVGLLRLDRRLVSVETIISRELKK